MASGNSLAHALVIDEANDSRETTASVTRQRRIKFLEGACCSFLDAGTSSNDAMERHASMKKLLVAVILCIIFMSIEVVGGIMANSLAILTDAAHLLSDVASFAISLFSLRAAGWEPTPRQTYGFFRIEILGALVSMQLIWLLTGILMFQAIVRLLSGSGEVEGSLMFGVAAFGLVVNLTMAFLLGHDHGQGNRPSGPTTSLPQDSERRYGYGIEVTTHRHRVRQAKLRNDEHQPLLRQPEDPEENCADPRNTQEKERNINVQGPYLHVLGDTIQSVGVMVGGAIIWYKPEWNIIDVISTLTFSVIVLATTIKMLRSILEILMESTPREIDATKLEAGLCMLDGVLAVHELHIWAITVGKVLLACHVTITPDTDADSILDKVVGYIEREYNISHVTIQIERQ